jgi:hypothetical protein
MGLFGSSKCNRRKYRWNHLKILIVGGITVTLMHFSPAVMQNNTPLEMLSVETAATDNIY